MVVTRISPRLIHESDSQFVNSAPNRAVHKRKFALSEVNPHLWSDLAFSIRKNEWPRCKRMAYLFEVNCPCSPREGASTIDFAKQEYSAILRRMHQIVEHDEDFPRLNADLKVN
jgi:hypothetical protein